MSASFNDATAEPSFFISGADMFGLVHFKIHVGGTSRRVKIGINGIKRLHKPWNERSAIFVVRCSSTETASIQC